MLVILRALCLAGVALLSIPAPAADLSRTEVYDKLKELDQEEAERRNRLLEAITSSDRTTRRVSVAELRGGFAADTQTTEGLLRMLQAEADGEAGFSTEARINVLYLLAGAEDAAWTPETVASARAILDAYGAAEHFDPGTQERGLMDELDGRLEALSGTRAAFGVVSEGVVTRAQFTDVDLFVCEYAAEDAALVGSARTFAETLASEEFGRIRLRRASEALATEVNAEPGASTVVYDAGHREEKEGYVLEALLADTTLPAPRLVANSGTPSHWYLSVFVCP